MSHRILIIEDERDIRELIRLALESGGFKVCYEADDGERGLEMARTVQPDLILLDIMLPGMDGLSVCRALKADERTAGIPVVMLSALGEEADVVSGLEIGASDYVTKPFSRRILVARVRAQLRAPTAEPSVEIRIPGLVINTETHSALASGVPLDLTAGEFATLTLLASHPGRVYTRSQIINSIKGDDYPVTERSVDVQMVNLRKKLGDLGPCIETVRGVGYRMKQE